MHGKTHKRTPTTSSPGGAASATAPAGTSQAITWIDRTVALVARTSPDATVDVEEFRLPADDAGRMHALADIAHAIGERDRVVLMGDEELRTLLEREYVAIFRRPDRLVDVTSESTTTRPDVGALLRDLTT